MFYTLASQRTNPDLIVIGSATAPGSRYGAFAKEAVDVDVILGRYVTSQRGWTTIRHPTDPTDTSTDYAISCRDAKGDWHHANASLFDACAGRFMDESMTEAGENCRFTVIKGSIVLVSTRPIERHEQILGRYGQAYWCKPRWPLSLLRDMHIKYRPTLSKDEHAVWTTLLREKEQQAHLQTMLPPPTGILKTCANSIPLVTPRPRSLVTPQCNRARARAKRHHSAQVRQGVSAPIRPLPSMNEPPPFEPPFTPKDWTYQFPPSLTEEGMERDPAALLRTMAWSCQGRLFAQGNIYTSGVRQFLSHAVDLLKTYRLDVLWLNDARFTAGMLEPYLPTLQLLLPGCRIFQFPTKRVHTGSRCASFNHMGGAIAIVTHDWHGYVTNTVADPTGSGLINGIDLAVGSYSIRLINSYFVPRQSSHGPATIHSRLQSYIQGPTAPKWSKKMSPIDYQLAYVQILLNTAKAKGMVSIFTGDTNRSISSSSRPGNRKRFDRWIQTNQLAAPMESTLHGRPGYHTWRSPSERQSDTIIDHVLHSALPDSMSLDQVGTVYDDVTNNLSDHRPIWISLRLHAPLSRVPPRVLLPTKPRLEIDMESEEEREDYNIYLTERLKKPAYKALHRLDPEGKPCCTPQKSGQLLAAVARESVQTTGERKQGLDKAKAQRISRRCAVVRGSTKNGYSLQMRQMQVHLYFYQNLVRLAFPNGKRRRPLGSRWNAGTYQAMPRVKLAVSPLQRSCSRSPSMPSPESPSWCTSRPSRRVSTAPSEWSTAWPSLRRFVRRRRCVRKRSWAS